MSSLIEIISILRLNHFKNFDGNRDRLISVNVVYQQDKQLILGQHLNSIK